MTRIGLAAVLTLSLTGPAFADVSGLVGNTVIATTSDGITRRIRLHADGTFLISVSDGTSATGRWSEKDGKLCYDRDAPIGHEPPPQLCVEGFAGHRLGDRWTLPGHKGLVMTAKVVKGQTP